MFLGENKVWKWDGFYSVSEKFVAMTESTASTSCYTSNHMDVPPYVMYVMFFRQKMKPSVSPRQEAEAETRESTTLACLLY